MSVSDRQWLPISKTPKDGTHLMLKGEWANDLNGSDEYPEIGVGYFNKDEWVASHCCCYTVSCIPVEFHRLD